MDPARTRRRSYCLLLVLAKNILSEVNVTRIQYCIILLILFFVTPIPTALAQDTAGEFDNGKMWTFDYPPADFFESTYGFEPADSWFEKARLGSLRLPNCSASFVSPHGLVMTNHHCGRSSVAQVSRDGEDLLHEGFVASALKDERHIEGLYVDQLISIEDVTDEVFDSVREMETDAEKAAARQDAITAITERLLAAAGGEAAGMTVQVISLYNGGRYAAYTYKRFSNIKLVMAPELQLGYFGGDTDNFTYPRYALDMTFFRVYQDDKPYQPEHYFSWSMDGASEGDPVFVVGNPGSTLRLETMAQLEWRRDVQEKYILNLLNSRIDALQTYYDENPSPELLNQIFGLKNTQKLYTGRVKGLNDPMLMSRRADTERQFLSDLDALLSERDSEVNVPGANIIDDIAVIQREKRTLAGEYGAFLALFPGGSLSSATLGRAMLARTYSQQQNVGVSEDQLLELTAQIASIEQDSHIDRLFLEARLRDFATYLGSDDATVTEILKGRSPEEVATSVISNSIFSDTEKLSSAIASGTFPETDPALAIVEAISTRLQNYQSAFAGLGARETELNAQHGRARFEIYGTERPPDATFSLRIADGVVSSYEYNGTHAPAFTTFYGLYNRHYSHALSGDAGEWDLPQRWLTAPGSFDRATKLNLVSTNDIIGGNSGSPLLDKNLNVVGLVFDGNIESLPSAFIYQTDKARAVSVDVRGMRAALDHVYDADRIVYELETGTIVETEEEADVARE